MRYIITSRKFVGEIEVKFNSQSYICAFDIRAQLTGEQINYFLNNLPIREEGIDVFKSDTVTIKMLPDDLTFESFWKRYDYKVGHKKKAEKMWERMSDAERMKAIEWLKNYDTQLKFTGVAKMYPETYLLQKRYLN